MSKRLHPFPTVQDGSAIDRVLDAMPRRPVAFLAMVERIESEREHKVRLAAARGAGRVRYLRRYRKRGEWMRERLH